VHHDGDHAHSNAKSYSYGKLNDGKLQVLNVIQMDKLYENIYNYIEIILFLSRSTLCR
jgi:hypothetical protein